MKNLDLHCAELGAKLEHCDAKILTNALGILEENGLYAFFLFLESKSNDNTANSILTESNSFLQRQKLLYNDDKAGLMKALRKEVLSNLDTMLFAQDLLRRALTYARYHAKAAALQQKPNKQNQTDNKKASNS